MSTPEAFASECRTAATSLRQAPVDLKHAIAEESTDLIARPLVGKIVAAAGGPHRAVLAAGTKAPRAVNARIVIGGKSPKLSGGAGPVDLVFGTEFGGGSHLGSVGASRRSRAYRRHTTRQFRTKHPFIYPTIKREYPRILDGYADIVLTVLDEAVR